MGTLRSILEAINKGLSLLLTVLQARRQRRYEDDVNKIKADPNAAFDDMFGPGRVHQPESGQGSRDLPGSETPAGQPPVSDGSGDR